MAGKVSIFLISPTYEKLLSTAVITQGAVAQGMEVFIFASFAQVAFRKGEVEKFSKLGKDYEEYKDVAMKYLASKNVTLSEPPSFRAGSRQLVLHAEGGQEDGQGQDSGLQPCR